MDVLGLQPGSVTPFGVINDTDKRVKVVLDKALMTCEILNFHPMTNTATTQIKPEELQVFLRYTGHCPVIVEF